MTNGIDMTWGCMSPSRKLKNGNSVMVKSTPDPANAPVSAMLLITRVSRNHHQKSLGCQATPPPVPSRPVIETRFQKSASPTLLAWKNSSTPTRLPTNSRRKTPAKPAAMGPKSPAPCPATVFRRPAAMLKTTLKTAAAAIAANEASERL